MVGARAATASNSSKHGRDGADNRGKDESVGQQKARQELIAMYPRGPWDTTIYVTETVVVEGVVCVDGCGGAQNRRGWRAGRGWRKGARSGCFFSRSSSLDACVRVRVRGQRHKRLTFLLEMTRSRNNLNDGAR